jgi:hypothetical protein
VIDGKIRGLFRFTFSKEIWKEDPPKSAAIWLQQWRPVISSMSRRG